MILYSVLDAAWGGAQDNTSLIPRELPGEAHRGHACLRPHVEDRAMVRAIADAGAIPMRVVEGQARNPGRRSSLWRAASSLSITRFSNQPPVVVFTGGLSHDGSRITPYFHVLKSC